MVKQTAPLFTSEEKLTLLLMLYLAYKIALSWQQYQSTNLYLERSLRADVL